MSTTEHRTLRKLADEVASRQFSEETSRAHIAHDCYALGYTDAIMAVRDGNPEARYHAGLPTEESTLNELAAASHADATRRGIYPQSDAESHADIMAEAEEVDAAYHDVRDARPDWHEHYVEERVDLLLVILSSLHDEDVDIDAEVARKMAVNRTRGPRA